MFPILVMILSSVDVCHLYQFSFVGVHPFPALPFEKPVVESRTCSIEVQCTDCVAKTAICAREFDPKKVLSKTACCEKGFNLECCAKLATTVFWKAKKLHDAIREMDEKKECKNEEFYCICDAYKVANVSKSSGICCGNGTCDCCETDPSITTLKPIFISNHGQCGDMCALSEGKPSTDCCEEDYALSNHVVLGKLRMNSAKDKRNEICGVNRLLFNYSPDFVRQPFHDDGSSVCADETVWFLFAQKGPPPYTPSKAIGMPSATYAIVVALVLVRFVFLPLMISGQ